MDAASNVEKKALPEGWCVKVVKIQFMGFSSSVSLANLKIAIARAYKQAPHLCSLLKKNHKCIKKKNTYVIKLISKKSISKVLYKKNK